MWMGASYYIPPPTLKINEKKKKKKKSTRDSLIIYNQYYKMASFLKIREKETESKWGPNRS